MKRKKTTKLYLSPQNIAVLKHLRTLGPLTPLSAMVNYGVTRLAARVHELKTMGEKIVTTIKTVNRHKYASYRL
jgi:hypothetical protein